jgi:hypothetical protein
MDRVLRSGSGESEIEHSESLLPQEKGKTYVQGIFDRICFG